MIDGIYRLYQSEEHLPVNIGNPHEISVLQLAELINRMVGNSAGLTYRPAMRIESDPQQRRPDIAKAIEILNWEPEISLEDGLLKTIPYFQETMKLS